MVEDAQRRETGLCPHFGECGGCQSQDVEYPDQLAAKEALLRGIFEPFWDGAIPVTPSPVLWHYRNKVDPAFAPMRYPEAPPARFARETVLGFKKQGRWYWPLDIEECRIAPEGLDALLAAMRIWHREQGLRAFDSRSEEGFLRVLLVRDAKRTGERMVVVITRDGDFDGPAFVDAVQGAFPSTSIYRGIFRGKADVAAADELELLDGKAAITEELRVPDGDAVRALRFRISPMSFFQTNTLATEKLYGMIREWVRKVAPKTLYDLYGGAGGIAFTCSDLAEEVWSVENVVEASEDGRHNAALNRIENVTFVTEKVKNYLRLRLRDEGLGEGAAAILDPPRSGLHPKAQRRIIELGPEHLLYVSCNPKILVREMPGFLEAYRLESMRAVDLFPHTRHVEVLAEFVRK